PGEDAERVKPVPASSRLRSGKSATPSIIGSVVWPAKCAGAVAPPGSCPMTIVTLPRTFVTIAPFVSRTLTCTLGVMAAPAGVLAGCRENTSTRLPEFSDADLQVAAQSQRSKLKAARDDPRGRTTAALAKPIPRPEWGEGAPTRGPGPMVM